MCLPNQHQSHPNLLIAVTFHQEDLGLRKMCQNPHSVDVGGGGLLQLTILRLNSLTEQGDDGFLRVVTILTLL